MCDLHFLPYLAVDKIIRLLRIKVDALVSCIFRQWKPVFSLVSSPDLEHNNDYIPDLVIDKILQFLPTKDAVHLGFLSNQWREALAFVPVLDFDEDEGFDEVVVFDEDDHNDFINFLDCYLKFREKYDQRAVLEKLRLHMRMGEYESNTIKCDGKSESTAIKWLEYAFERGVKEVDICSLVYRPKDVNYRLIYYYRLPAMTFANAKFLTTLSLECFTIMAHEVQSDDQPLFPSLKTMSLRHVRFGDQALVLLLSNCPSIEYLSLIWCNFEKLECRVTSCWRLSFLEFRDDDSLESFTLVSPPSSKMRKVILTASSNLKHIDIRVGDLEQLCIEGCQRARDANININIDIQNQNLLRLKLACHLKANLSFKPSQNAMINCSIETWDDEKGFLSPSTHFPALISFLEKFGCCKEITLTYPDYKDLIISKNMRKEFSAPLPKNNNLIVNLLHPPNKRSRDHVKLINSLRWIAPLARITIVFAPWIDV